MSDDTLTMTIAPEEIEDQTPEPAQEPHQKLAIHCRTEGCGQSFIDTESFEAHVKAEHLEKSKEIVKKKEDKIDSNRNENGQFVAGNNASVGNHGGRQCSFCVEPVKYISKTNLYLEYCQGKVAAEEGSKVFRIPYIEELAENLGILTETIEDWTENKTHPELHTEFVHAIKRLKMLQKLRLQQRTMNANPAGSIFLLKANHGMIETEKQILAGSGNEPIAYNIHIVPRKKQEEIEGE